MNNYLLQWHAKFSQFNLGDLGVLFMSESEEYLVERAHYESLNIQVLSLGKLSDYVFQSEDVEEQISRIKQADKFLNDQLLTEADDGIVSQYFKPDFTHPVMNTSFGDKQIYSLSCCVDAGSLVLALNELKLFLDVNIVVVDDYHDPRLLELSDRLGVCNQDWLLVKLSGESSILGPYFKHNEENTPCFNCFIHRLRQNKPVREWYKRYYADDNDISIPILRREEHIDDLLNKIIKQLDQVPEVQLNNHLFEFSHNNIEIITHYIEKRPQCSCCGDPQLFEKNITAPVLLEDCFKDTSLDGGYRSVSRDKTLNQISKLISPYTGVITNLLSLTPVQSEKQLNIYRAAYFQNSYSNQLLTPDTFVQLSLGKGIYKTQAKTSALGEAIERMAAQYAGEEPWLLSVPEKLANRYYLPQDLCPFSQTQYQQFEQFTKTSLQHPQWVKPYDTDIELHWTPAWSLSQNERVYFPFSYCYANTPFEDYVYSLYNHNGNSAGNTREEAILQGALEVIERDAVAIWWYNQIPRPEISLSIIEQDMFEHVDNTLGDEWDYWLLDISNDIEVISCVSVGQHKLTKKFVLGFGTHLKPDVACQRAITEMYQLIIVKDKVTGPFDFNVIEPEAFLFPGRNSDKKTHNDYRIVNTDNIKYDIYYILEILKSHDLDLCLVDYSRPDLKLKTLKVIIPGLCHMWPQFDNKRLFEVPVKLSWLTIPLQESELNPMPLFL